MSASSSTSSRCGDALDRVDRGSSTTPGPTETTRSRRRVPRKYGINKSRFWVVPANNLRMFVLNTSSPLFRNNPKLRQAVNFAVDREGLLRERGPLAGTLTDQYLPPGLPGFRNERIYPLDGPDLKKARAAREGAHAERQGRAVHPLRTQSASPRRRSSRTT